jgi:hypothetical protein
MSPVIGRAACLRMKLDLGAPPLNAAIAKVWRPDGLAERYVRYLCAMHEVIRASVPLMELAARRCRALGPDDPLAGPLADYLDRHAVEERGHDDWLLRDLTAAGAAACDVAARQPSARAARLVGAQYYWIEHFHPVALLGYIAALEGNSPAPGLAQRLARACGLPASAFRTLDLHATLDRRHQADLDSVVDALPLSREQEIAVSVSALHTVAELIEVFAELAHPPHRADPPVLSPNRSTHHDGRRPGDDQGAPEGRVPHGHPHPRAARRVPGVDSRGGFSPA